MQRKCPVGPEVFRGGTDFRVWAPRRKQVELVLEGPPARPIPMDPEALGYFHAHVEGVEAGARYRYRLDADPRLYPDPASRSQPEGPDGPSVVVRSSSFRWTDDAWKGVSLPGQVIYEMHVGTFTPEGTWARATTELAELASLGITTIEMMPIGEFAGRFGWGYDGVLLFAPTRLYGSPDDLRGFVDRAHALGMGVILDVVYNHFGPVGNYLPQFSNGYLNAARPTEWGDAVNFDGPGCEGTREFVQANAAYWIREFHFDGLRLDATHEILDDSETHILAEIRREVREAARGRSTLVVCENEPGNARLLRPEDRGGYGLDAMFCEDFHHTARVALGGQREAYYTDYLGTPQELLSALRRGSLYQGQYYEWQRKTRGRPALDIPAARFVTALENHDQVANTARGERLWRLTDPARLRAMIALYLLGPGTPMLFQGEEFAASAPFSYFADHDPELAATVRKGRVEFLSQFPSIAQADVAAAVAAPDDPRTFESCKLDFAERTTHKATYELYRDLLALRRLDPVFRRIASLQTEGAVLGDASLLLRVLGGDGDDRLIVTNLGRSGPLSPCPEPLLAPPEGKRWSLLLSTEATQYGGHGTAPTEDRGRWTLMSNATCVFGTAPEASP